MTIQNRKQAPLSRMTAFLDDFLLSVLKAIIVKIVVDIIYKYAKRELRWVMPYLNKYRFRSGFIMHFFALKLKLESVSTFMVAVVTLACKTATDEQKVALRRILSDDFSHEPLIR
jgi:chromate transport protein ChrA